MKIFVLDDSPNRHDAFDDVFSKDFIDHAWTYFDAISLLDSGKTYDMIYLDHDLNDFESSSMFYEPNEGRSIELTGADVARFIARTQAGVSDETRIIVHSWNSQGALRMLNILRDAGIRCTYEPFASS